MYSLHHLSAVAVRPATGARGLGMDAGSGVAKPGGVTEAAMVAESTGLQPPYLGSWIERGAWGACVCREGREV